MHVCVSEITHGLHVEARDSHSVSSVDVHVFKRLIFNQSRCVSVVYVSVVIQRSAASVARQQAIVRCLNWVLGTELGFCAALSIAFFGDRVSHCT